MRINLHVHTNFAQTVYHHSSPTVTSIPTPQSTGSYVHGKCWSVYARTCVRGIKWRDNLQHLSVIETAPTHTDFEHVPSLAINTVNTLANGEFWTEKNGNTVNMY